MKRQASKNQSAKTNLLTLALAIAAALTSVNAQDGMAVADLYDHSYLYEYTRAHERYVLLPEDHLEAEPARSTDASFPGGAFEYGKFIMTNFQYPNVDRETSTEGRVLASFVVQRDGSLTDITIVKSVSPTLDAEVIRVLEMMPDWNPATKDGKAVKSRVTIPISATLK